MLHFAPPTTRSTFRFWGHTYPTYCMLFYQETELRFNCLCLPFSLHSLVSQKEPSGFSKPCLQQPLCCKQPQVILINHDAPADRGLPVLNYSLARSSTLPPSQRQRKINCKFSSLRVCFLGPPASWCLNTLSVRF